jgi:hypothetical protein
MKKYLSILLAIIIASSMVSFSGITAFATDLSGNCGEGVTWKYTESNKTLTISGNNIMDDYAKISNSYNRPWESLAESIECVVIKDGVLSIGDYAFAGFKNLKDVTIPETVLVIGEGAFKSCTTLRFIDLGKNVMAIGPSAFEGCSVLSFFVMSKTTVYIGDNAFEGCPLHYSLYSGIWEQEAFIFFEDESERKKVCNNLWPIDVDYDLILEENTYDVLTVVGEEPFKLTKGKDDLIVQILEAEYGTFVEDGIEYYYGAVAVAGLAKGFTTINAVNEDNEKIGVFSVLVGCSSGKHDLKHREVGREPTCMDKGFDILTCDDCPYTESVETTTTKHSFKSYETVKEATCMDKGVEKSKCTYCEKVNERDIPAKGHIWSEWTVTVEPTEEEKGQQERTCSNCNGKETKEILSLSESKGDVNGDGKITAVDARMILQHVAGINKLDEHQLKLADVNGDGKISAVDARRVLRIVAGITE